MYVFLLEGIIHERILVLKCLQLFVLVVYYYKPCK